MSKFFLDIGGTKFTTTIETLSNIPYFSKYFERWDKKDNSIDNPYFVDQDGDDFKFILKWARDPNYEMPIDVNVEYWGLEKKFCEKPKNKEKKNRRESKKFIQIGHTFYSWTDVLKARIREIINEKFTVQFYIKNEGAWHNAGIYFNSELEAQKYINSILN